MRLQISIVGIIHIQGIGCCMDCSFQFDLPVCTELFRYMLIQTFNCSLKVA